MMCYCFSATSEETPYEQLLPYWVKVPKNRENVDQYKPAKIPTRLLLTCSFHCRLNSSKSSYCQLTLSTFKIQDSQALWGYLEFICCIIVWNIWKLKKFLLCAFGFANLDICWSRLMAVFILLCCTLWIIFLNNSNNKSNRNFWLIFHIIWISNAWP